MKAEEVPEMEYRSLGPTGIKVSVISFGNWVNSNKEEAKQNTIDCIQKAWDHGVNFFDTAEVYGNSSLIQGLERLKGRWERVSEGST